MYTDGMRYLYTVSEMLDGIFPVGSEKNPNGAKNPEGVKRLQV